MLLAPVPALFYALLSQKLAPAEERNSTDMSAASAAFCISAKNYFSWCELFLGCSFAISLIHNVVLQEIG